VRHSALKSRTGTCVSDVENVEIMEKITLAESARQCGNVDLAMKILIEALIDIMRRRTQ
jgi:hypothetical protein